MNNKTSVKSDVGCLLDTSGVTHTNDPSKANALNDYSPSVFTTDNGSLPKREDVYINPPVNNIEAVYFSPDSVRSVIKTRKNKNSAGITAVLAHRHYFLNS